MSRMIKIQEYAMVAFKVNKLAKFKKGETLVARFEKVRTEYVKMLVSLGWPESDAQIVIKDAEDMALLELNAA